MILLSRLMKVLLILTELNGAAWQDKENDLIVRNSKANSESQIRYLKLFCNALYLTVADTTSAYF